MEKEKARKECLAFLKANEYGVVATIAKNGTPQAATVTYLIDDDFTIYFATRRTTRKYKNLEQNNAIAMVMGTGPAAISVQLHGTTEIIEGEAREKTMERFLMKHESYYRIFLKMPGYDFAVFKITPTWIRLFNVEEKEEMFREIL